ncbi:class I SAM-dependent methyltransferase [Spongiactinospora gelatinilytica]|uniref:Class I SAM-dependent methyltransferase n=1 Tax=Spongiactinospora gelatinilytica TaxID=2666298 RepID=A0A2W2GD89_9ACTN|nr:class I SAM-dependent methyltransferase [Spongiactinospora gelatinilytica]PZG38225.1 class I SAM-dependent methyltransferase [Spongiactinospora gelatinilytica]
MMDAHQATELAAALIAVADGDPAALTGTIERAGAGEVAALLADEMAFRCGVPAHGHEVGLRLDLLHEGKRWSRVLRCVPYRGVVVEPAGAVPVAATLTARLEETARGLFGPGAARRAGWCEVAIDEAAWPEIIAADGIAPHELKSAVRRAVDTVLATRTRRPDLEELTVAADCDKWGLVHWFAPHYDLHFRGLRERAVRVLEIGIGGYDDPDAGGESLRVWRRYFGRGLIFGLDVAAKGGLDAPRLTTLVGSQADRGRLRALAARYGPFDVVIDDGSHVGEHVLTAFEELFPHVRAGGCYAIEDLWSSYCPGYGGDGTDPGAPGTSVALLKSLIDRIHHREWGEGDEDSVGADTAGLHVYHNLAVIEKGVNAEIAIAPRIHRAARGF